MQDDAAGTVAGRGAPAAGGAARYLCGRQQDELAALLRALQQAVALHRRETRRPYDVEGMAGIVARQLASGQRLNRPMVHALLDGIAEAAAPARPLVEAAEALACFVDRLG